MKNFTLTVTDAQTWGNGHDLREAMFQAFNHCSWIRKPTEIKVFHYQAKAKGDVYITEIGYLVTTNGAQIIEETPFLPIEPRAFRAYLEFIEEVNAFECDYEGEDA